MTFAFGTAVLAPIDEDFEGVDASCIESVSTAKATMQASKVRTAELSEAACKDIFELTGLLAKLKTDTATREEKDRVRALHSKLDGMKREIEASKDREIASEMDFLHSKTKEKTFALKSAVKEKEVRSVIRAVCAAESVDLAFVMDCTGSMSSYVAAVKNNINDVVDRIRRTNGNLKLRLAMVGYRDLCDEAKHFEVLDFVSSVEDFKSFVGCLSASGGGDAPEDIAGAVQKTNKLTWKHPTRVVFLIADAPCHGREYHSEHDSYPDGTPGIDIVAELRNLLSLKENGTMTVNFGRITHATDKMINRLNDYGVCLEVVSIRDTAKVSACVTKSVRKSIFKTMTFVSGGTKSVAFGPIDLGRTGSVFSLKAYKINPVGPSAEEWMHHPAVAVLVYRNRRIKSFADLQAPIGIGILHFPHTRTDKTNESTMFIRRATEPFAEGEIRIAYHAQLARKKEDLDDATKSTMVLKSFKHVGKGLNDRQQYLKQMEVSTIAHFLATEYNKSSFRPSHCAAVRVLQVCVVEEEDATNEVHGHRRFCAEERLPNGGTEFIKFSNNTGQWDEDNMDESLLRFSDYSYQMTKGYLMVTDLQGIKNGNEFVITDPVILCQDIHRFGNTNLGDKFIKKCIDSTRAFMSEKGFY